MNVNVYSFFFCINKLNLAFRPEGPEYFSPGHSFRRNDGNDALGYIKKKKTVREVLKIKDEKSYGRNCS